MNINPSIWTFWSLVLWEFIRNNWILIKLMLGRSQADIEIRSILNFLFDIQFCMQPYLLRFLPMKTVVWKVLKEQHYMRCATQWQYCLCHTQYKSNNNNNNNCLVEYRMQIQRHTYATIYTWKAHKLKLWNGLKILFFGWNFFLRFFQICISY